MILHEVISLSKDLRWILNVFPHEYYWYQFFRTVFINFFVSKNYAHKCQPFRF